MRFPFRRLPLEWVEPHFGLRKVAHALSAAILLSQRLDGGQHNLYGVRLDTIRQAVADAAAILEEIG